MLAMWALCLSETAAEAQPLRRFPPVIPEEKTLHVRPAPELLPAPVPFSDRPPTVATHDLQHREPRELSLDEAIRIALANSEVVRVLAGNTAVASGSTVYDPAIVSKTIDEQRARFDPTFNVANTWNQFDVPFGTFSLLPPFGDIFGLQLQDYGLAAGVNKTTLSGGTAGVNVLANNRLFDQLNPLDPATSSTLEFSYIQPLLQGGGIRANTAPIVVAQINTEISFYELKRSLQDLVRGVIEAYWGVVFARVDFWARRQQVEQSQFAYELAEASKERGLVSAADVAQARVALSNFRADLIAAEANLLQREAQLRNILGLPPADLGILVPVTPPTNERYNLSWQALVEVAEAQRPDIAQLKLTVESTELNRLVAENAAHPRVDFVSAYRMNSLNGTTPAGATRTTQPGEFTGWTLGVTVTTPLGRRGARAALRAEELAASRNRALLRQGIHNAQHELATSYRDADQFYEQYLVFKETREASLLNLREQIRRYRVGGIGGGPPARRVRPTTFLDVLTAIASWGDAVSNEAATLAAYNTELANISRNAGTILMDHGVEMLQFDQLFTKPPVHHDLYPAGVAPGGNMPRYPTGSRPAEESFNLEVPSLKSPTDDRQDEESLPRPQGAERLPVPSEASTPQRIHLR